MRSTGPKERLVCHARTKVLFCFPVFISNKPGGDEVAVERVGDGWTVEVQRSIPPIEGLCRVHGQRLK